jgi:hypothetical protein
VTDGEKLMGTDARGLTCINRRKAERRTIIKSSTRVFWRVP